MLLAVFVLWPRSAPTSTGAPLADFKASDVTGLKISDQDKNMVELKKLGSDWVLADADSFPWMPAR